MTAAHSNPQPDTTAPQPMWRPGPERIRGAAVTRFQDWAAHR